MSEGKKGCPYSDHSPEGVARQVQLEYNLEEWKRKNRTKYDSMITYLKEERGLAGEFQRHITYKDDDFVLTHDLKKGCSGSIITVMIPTKYEVGIYKGIHDIEYPDIEKYSPESAYEFKIKAADVSGKEVNDTTRVEVLIFNPNKKMFRRIIETPYRNVRSGIKFSEHGSVERLNLQVWRLIDPDVDVVWQNVEYYGVWDLWSKERTCQK